MWRQNIILLVAAFLTTTYGRSATSSGLPLHPRQLENVHYDGGVPWMLIPDDKGVLHIAILTEVSPPVDRDVAADVHLNLYTNLDGGSTPYRLLVNDTDNLARSAFNPQNTTKILIHGFGGSGDDKIIINGKNAYLARGDYNVIVIDWGVLAANPYASAVANARPTGEHIADLIEFLVAQTTAKLEDFHIIGGSLGAQVAGFAGNATTTGKVGRITGLDAAYPLFGNAPPEGRLDAGDAILVDAIHTCSGLLGFKEPYAHVDFYPNKGTRVQPECEGPDIACACSHPICADYFLYTAKDENAFPSVECLSLDEALSGNCTGNATAYMGEILRFDKYGIYYLETTNVPIFP